VGIVDDRLANSWIDSYLNTDVDTSASDWAAEFADTHQRIEQIEPSNQLIPIEHQWAQEFLGQCEHDIW